MSTFESLRARFEVNWTTVLVGWNGLGVLSPWPDRWIEFPPLLTANEIAGYCDEKLASSSDTTEQDLVLEVLSSDLESDGRAMVRDLLAPLSALSKGDPSIELRKWRLVLLEEVLASMPDDTVYGLMALTEFWQNFGYPPDSPHDVQGRGNAISPAEYYQQDNLDRLVARHRDWVEIETAALRDDSRRT